MMEVLHSPLGHPPSDCEQWMKMIDKISIDDPGFSRIPHNQCICRRTDSEGTVLILRQVDDFPIGTKDKETAKRSANQIGERVKFKHEKDMPITFMGLVDDCNGAEIEQCNDLTLMSSGAHIERSS